jgi:hypothetical protein
MAAYSAVRPGPLIQEVALKLVDEVLTGQRETDGIEQQSHRCDGSWRLWKW